MGYYSKLASAVYNDIVGGLRGYTSNPTMSIEQLEDDLSEMRLTVIKEYSLKGLLPKDDLLRSISCIPVDCKNIENCNCGNSSFGTPTLHFEIPQIITDFNGGIEYVGTIDKQNSFYWYTNPNSLKYHKYRKRASKKPYVYIDITPNKNGMLDCWVFGIPILKKITVIGIFKNLNLLEGCEACNPDNLSFLDSEIKRRVTELKIKYYRQLQPPIYNNDQAPK